MSRDALETLLRELARNGRSWVELAVVTKVEADTNVGVMLECQLVPSGEQLLARPMLRMGGQPGEGDFGRLEVDTEVLILLPGGDRNRAVAIASAVSGASKPPAGWLGDSRQIVDRDGLDVRTAEGTTTVPTVTASLLGDLESSLSEMRAALLGLGVASLPQTDSLLAAISTSYRGIVRTEEA